MATAPFTSELAESLAPELLERFSRYVRIDTQSARGSDSWPSTPGQLELGRLLVEELKELGLTDAAIDDGGYVMATLPGTNGARNGPAIGLLAHVDTTPDAPGAGVEPLVHQGYHGGVIELPKNGTRLDPEAMPELQAKRGHDIVTGSGDTLLGADDKAGVAEIMTAVSYLTRHPELPRPTFRIGFTPDEEIGLGATRFDIERFGARCAYTVDGSELGELQDETFSAVEVTITVRGVDVHPGMGTGKLVNALRLAAKIVASLPADRLAPENTADRDGFIHPYTFTGTPAEATISSIVRDFDDDLLNDHIELLKRTAHEIVDPEPRARLEVTVKPGYRNMLQYIEQVPEIVATAAEAIRAEGIEPLRRPIRGGTDGSLLSERGLPTPNIFTGGHDYHSVREWASLQDMAAAAATLVRLAGAWARTESSGATS
jgi:tripeptide aminopeptidase